MDNEETYLPYYDQKPPRADGMREALTVIFKHKTKILAVFFAVIATVLVADLLVPAVYEARSSILVKIGREYLNRQEVGNGVPIVQVSHDELTNSEIQILTDRDLIKKVIKSIGVGAMYPALVKDPHPEVDPLEAAADLFAKKLKVEAVKKASVIQISFRHHDPKIAALAVNTLVDQYRVKHLQVFSDDKSPFLEKQLSVYEQKLRASENSLQRFKQQNGVYSLDDQRRLLLDQRTALDSALKGAQDAVAEQQRRIATLSGQRQTLSASDTSYTNTERDKIIVDARSRLLALQIDEQELLKKYTENNRLVVSIRGEIKMVQNYLREQETDISRRVKSANPVYQNVQIGMIQAEAEYHAQQARAATIRRQLGELDGKLSALDYREKELQQLKRDQAINEKNYQSFADRTEESRISDDMDRLKLSNVSVIEKASVPITPVSPKKTRNIALALICGALAGLGTAFLADAMTQGFSTPESVEKRLALPVLAAIPYRGG